MGFESKQTIIKRSRK